MPEIIYAVVLAVSANTFVYAGIAFYTGRLLPSLGHYIYLPTEALRLVAALLTFFFAANICFSKLYTIVSPVTAGIISVSANVIVMGVSTLIMEQRYPSFGMLMGASLALCGAITVIGSR